MLILFTRLVLQIFSTHPDCLTELLTPLRICEFLRIHPKGYGKRLPTTALELRPVSSLNVGAFSL